MAMTNKKRLHSISSSSSSLREYFFTAFLLLFIIPMLLLSLISTGFAANKLDQIAAVANDDVVMLSEVHTQARQLKSQAEYARLPQQALLKKSLDLLILDKLQTQHAQKMGIVINDAMLDNTMQRLAKQNRMTLEQFRNAVKREGLDYKVFREGVRQRIVVSQLKKGYQQSNAINEKLDIDDLIANQSGLLSKNISYKFQHLLFPQKKHSRLPELKALKQHANTIRQRIIQGEDLLSFPNAQANNDWISATTLTPSFLRSINTLEKGQLSALFHDEKGFHLLKLVAKQGHQQHAIEEFNIRHILIKPTAQQKDQAVRANITKIRQQIIAGESFATLAQQHSDDKGSGAKGGELGWAALEGYVPAFSAMAKRSPIKQISPPFKTQFGWHILEVLEKRKSTQTTNNLRRQAKALLSKNQPNDAYTTWLQQLRNSAFVEYKINF